MKTQTNLEVVETIVAEAAKAAGLFVYDMDLVTERSRTILRVLVDRLVKGDEGVSIDECVGLSRQLSLLLDAADPLDFAYVLEVSSPGVERTLTDAHHFEHALGEQVRLILDTDFEGRTRYEGVLQRFTDAVISLSLPPKRKRRKKGQPPKEEPIASWEVLEIPRGLVLKASTIYTFSE